MREFEAPGLACYGPGERALLVAEQLGFEQILRDSHTVDRDKRTAGPRAERVEPASEELFPGAAFSLEQDRRIGRRRTVQLLGDLPERRIVPDDAGSPATLGHLFLEQEILGLHAALSDGALDQQQQVVGLDWLGEEVGGTLPHGGDGVLDAAVGGHHDDRHFRVQLLGRSQHAEPVAGR